MVLNFKEKFCVKFLMEPCAEDILSSNGNSHCMLKKRKKSPDCWETTKSTGLCVFILSELSA